MPAVTTPPGQVEQPPSFFRQVALRYPEVYHFRGTHGRVVHAAEERLEMRAAPRQLRDRIQQARHLRVFRDARRIYLIADRRCVQRMPISGSFWKYPFLQPC